MVIAKCPSLKSWGDWMDVRKGNRPGWKRITNWDFMNPKQWGSCFPINRLLLFLPRQLDGRHYLLPECLIKFWLCEAWVIRGKRCHPWDCEGFFFFLCSLCSIQGLRTEKESYCSCWAFALPTMPRVAKRRWSCYCVGDWNFMTLSGTSSSLDFEKQNLRGISMKG